MLVYRWIFAVLCTFVGLNAFGQGQPEEEHLLWYTHKDGLPDNTVQCILQDSRGFIWLGTPAGLSCFDGKRFTNYYKKGEKNRLSLPSNNITHLLATRDHKIAIGTSFGIAIIDPETRIIKSTPLPFLPEMEYIQNRVNSMVLTSDGHIAIGNNGGFYLYNSSLKLIFTYHHFKTNDLNKQAMGFAHELIAAENGDVVVRGWHGIFKYQNKISKVLPFESMTEKIGFAGNFYQSGIPMHAVYMDYFPTKLALINLTDSKFKVYGVDASLSKNMHWMSKLTWLSPTEVALSSHINGIQFFKIDPLQQNLIPESDVILENVHVNCFMKDQGGRWWFGTNNGLYFESLIMKKFKKVPLPEQSEALDKAKQPSAMIYSEGHFYIGSKDNYSIAVYDTLFTLKTLIPLPPKVYQLWHLEQWRPGVIEALCSRGWARLNISHANDLQFSWTFDTSLHSVFDVQPDHSGNLWLGNRNEVFKYFYESKQLQNMAVDKNGTRLPFQGAYRMTMTDSGYVWMAGLPGFNRWNPFTQSFDRRYERAPGTKGLEGFPNAVFPIPGNQILFSLDGNGLYQWDGSNNNAVKINTNFQGFDHIHQLQQDRDPFICWLTLAQGIGRFHTKTGKSDFIDLALLYPRLHQPSFRFYVDQIHHTGIVCYPGQILKFNLDDFSTIHPPEKVSVYSVSSINQKVEYPFHQFFHCRQENQGLVIQFGVPEFEQNQEYQFQYRMNEEEWHFLGSEGTLVFSDLRPGNYFLEIRCISQSGSTGLPANLKFKIVPYFYQTWWFLLLGICSTAAMSWLIFSILRRRKTAMENMRQAIAADLHDEVGASLTSIQILAQIASQGTPEKRDKALDKLPEQVKSTASALKEIVNYIQPSNGHAEVVLSELSRYAGETLEQSGIAYQIETDQCTADFIVNPQVKQHLGRMFKEILNNVTKHSQASLVHIQFDCSMDCLKLTVTDNGRGFDTRNHYPGQGLKNLQQRAQQIGASIQIESKVGLGTSYHIGLPIESSAKWWQLLFNKKR